MLEELLQHLPLFADLTQEQRRWLAERCGELHLNPGDTLFTEGEAPTCFHVVLSGLLQVTKRIEDEETEIDLLETGMYTGDIGLLIGLPHIATVRAVEPTHLLVFGADTFQQLVTRVPSVGKQMLSLMGARVQGAEVLVHEREKLAALGKLSAGLAHELNNPAAAGKRSANELSKTIQDIQTLSSQLLAQPFSPEQHALLTQLQQQFAQQPVPLETNSLEQLDREEALTTWLEEQEVENSWELAPLLVQANVQEAFLEKLVGHFSGQMLNLVLHWCGALVCAERLANEVSQSTSRIAELVGAIKSYSHMDQAPQQEIDIHEGLENTLMILKHKLKKGQIQVQRHYKHDIPHIMAYGSELNQVWTNLIDNAIDALEPQGGGQLDIMTGFDGTWVLVEIADNGPGITPDVQKRIFQPFFTTKAMGKGTGLGLDISYRIVVNRHHGTIRVTSQPGNTCFIIQLPVRPPAASSSVSNRAGTQTAQDRSS